MPAFAADGTVTCPFPAAWLEFFNADKDKWTANAYRTPDCIGSREFSHGSFVAALPDGSFPPTFLWDEISYRVIAKAADGTVIAKIDCVTPESEFAAVEPVAVAEPVANVAVSDPREEELAALRARVAELESRDASVFAEPVIQEPERARDELLDFDAEPVEELTGDQLLNAFEKDEEAAAVLIQTLSALRQKHISEQLNVERARLDREHQATGVANPRSAQIDRLLGLLTRRGEV